MPVWVIPIWWLDRDLQTEKDHEAAENVGTGLQAIGHHCEGVTHRSGRNLRSRQAKIHQNSQKRGSHTFFRDPLRDLIRTGHVLDLNAQAK